MNNKELLLGVINNSNVLIKVIRTIQQRRIAIQSFIANVIGEKRGTINIIVDIDNEQLKLLTYELECLKEVREVRRITGPLPSSELSSIYEE